MLARPTSIRFVSPLEGIMRLFALIGCAAIVAGCTKAEDRSVGAAGSTDTAPASADATAGTGAISLSSLAGTWKVHSTDENGGRPVDTELRATADTTGWTMTGPDKKAHPVRVLAVGGDSLVIESGPRPSYLQKGAMVTTRTVYRLEGDKLMGKTEAHVKMGGRDSVAQRINEATRVQ
jgi:hypothetical protein